MCLRTGPLRAALNAANSGRVRKRWLPETVIVNDGAR